MPELASRERRGILNERFAAYARRDNGRVEDGGGQGGLDAIPDLTAMGKIIGGGFPVGAIGGRLDVMAVFDPTRQDVPVPHGGTFNANPVTMRAGEAAIGSGDIRSVRTLSATSSGATGDRVSLFYGQSWALVTFLIETYGEEQFGELFRAFGEGANDDEAVEQVYGFDQAGFENAWRASGGL